MAIAEKQQCLLEEALLNLLTPWTSAAEPESKGGKLLGLDPEQHAELIWSHLNPHK